MFTNLKKVEKSINKIQKLEVRTPMVQDMLKLLRKEQEGLYATDLLLKGILTKDNGLRGLSIPKEIKHFKTTNSKAVISSAVSLLDYEHLLIGTNSIETERSLIYLLRNKNIQVRTPIMKPFILGKIIKSEDIRKTLMMDSSFTTTLNTPYGQCSFDFSLNYLDEETSNNIKDILKNFDAYKLHPEIGINVIKKELESNLDSYYNTTVFYFKDTESENVFEFVKN